MKRYLSGFFCLLALTFAFQAVRVSAATTNPSTQTTQTPTTTTETPQEPVTVPVTQEPITSDLTLIQAETVLDSARWIQSFAKDNTYYYFVQMTNPDKGHLRVTRVRYTGPGIYTKDHMDLLGFGHGTNMDCSTYKGKTYLWIGSCMDKEQRTTAISCFEYTPNAIYNRKAGKTYKFRMRGSLRKATNIFPAVSASGKYLYVRYTYKHKQHFMKYKIYKGNTVKTYKRLGYLCLPATAGDFQGFDATDTYVYTIEGSPSALFLAGYDKTRTFQPTIVRRTNFRTKSKKVTTIRGAANLTFREPEGIKIYKNGKQDILFVNNTLSFQKCNIYRIK